MGSIQVPKKSSAAARGGHLPESLHGVARLDQGLGLLEQLGVRATLARRLVARRWDDDGVNGVFNKKAMKNDG